METALVRFKRLVQVHHKVIDIRKYNDVFKVYIEHQQKELTQKVGTIVMATGTHTDPKRLNIEGEELLKLSTLYFPHRLPPQEGHRDWGRKFGIRSRHRTGKTRNPL